MNRCASCRHWNRTEEPDDGRRRCEAAGVDEADQALLVVVACDGYDHGDGDGSGRSGRWLMTAPTFGCALWEPAPLAQPG